MAANPEIVGGLMGWGGNIFPLLIITSSGGFTGLFVYSPGPGAGNLIFSVSGADGTDPYGNAYKTQATSYLAPGVGLAAGFQSGQMSLYTGPHSGAGPWTQQLAILATVPSGQIQINGQVAGNSIAISSGVGGSSGTFIDGQEYGGQTVLIPSGSTETYTNTTLATSTNLQMTGLFSQGIYQFHLNVVYAGAATNGGLKWSVATDGTGAASMIYAGATGAQVTNADQFPLSGHAAETIGTGFGNALGLTIDGVLFLPVASTGAVAMQFAQNAASATATTLFNGTYMRLWRIG